MALQRLQRMTTCLIIWNIHGFGSDRSAGIASGRTLISNDSPDYGVASHIHEIIVNAAYTHDAFALFFAVVEYWLQEPNEPPAVPNFTAFTRYRTWGEHGGVLVYIHNSIVHLCTVDMTARYGPSPCWCLGSPYCMRMQSSWMYRYHVQKGGTSRERV